jgi:microcystin degradation protein MlrC
MRIGIIGIMHESNTFIAAPTTLDDFRRDLLLVGDEIRERLGGAHHEVAGFLQTLDAGGAQAVPLFFARSLPSGTISAETLDTMIEMMTRELDRGGPLDGLLVCPHGANVSERHRDMDGHWLSLLRGRVGDAVPIVCTLDPHANLSALMVESVNATIAYRTNPHLDQRQRGIEAATLLLRILRGEVRPTQRAAFPPVAINIERQAPAQPPCRALYDLAEAMRQRAGVLSASIFLGFPYSDVEEMGSAVLVITDNDPSFAQRLADELAAHLVAHRHEFAGQLVTAEEAIADALTGEGPICLLDVGDNVGGGSPGDGALLARVFEEQAAAKDAPKRRAFICLYDPESVQRAAAAGIGARIALRMGGKSHPLYGPPLEAEVTVRSMHEGKFTETEVRHYGMTHFDMGLTALVETDRGLLVQLTSLRVYPTSLRQLTSCGIDPLSFQILVAKGVHAPVAAYAPVSKRLLRANTPGVTCADMRQLSYSHRRRPLFPFEEIASPNQAP